QAAARPAGGGLRRRELLLALRARAAARDRSACVHRHRVPDTRLRRTLPAARRRGRRLDRVTVPRAVRAGGCRGRHRGRRGAALPTGRKWDAVSRHPVRPHFLVCNADESEPGTFKDRIVIENDPFALVEAMTIAGYATGCELGYVYLRGEYPLAWERLHEAVA